MELRAHSLVKSQKEKRKKMYHQHLWEKRPLRRVSFCCLPLCAQMFMCSYIIGLHMFRNPHIHVLSGSAERAVLKQEKEVCGTNLVELVKRRVEPCKMYDR